MAVQKQIQTELLNLSSNSDMIWRSKSTLKHKIHPIIFTVYEEKAYNSGKKKSFSIGTYVKKKSKIIDWLLLEIRFPGYKHERISTTKIKSKNY